MDWEIDAAQATTIFEAIKHIDRRGHEYWQARELAKELGYEEWRNFENVVEKAKVSIVNSGETVDNHFVDINKMVQVGSNTMRQIKDVRLSRYACYVIAQNGDPAKYEIALAQAYFTRQTRRQELAVAESKEQERLEARQKLSVSDKELSSTAMSHGVDRKGLAVIKSRGDQRLFGGKSTQDMKTKYGIKDKKPLADRLPTISLTAKQLANEMTSLNTEAKNLQGQGHIGLEHLKNNDEIRKSLVSRGIKLEELPAEEDIKVVERRLKAKKGRTDELLGKG
jgi:DNA-damage-inducible protein D